MSTEIKINGEPFEVYPFDEENTILQRYSSEQDDSLPEYFRIVEEEFVLSTDLELHLEDDRKVPE